MTSKLQGRLHRHMAGATAMVATLAVVAGGLTAAAASPASASGRPGDGGRSVTTTWPDAHFGKFERGDRWERCTVRLRVKVRIRHGRDNAQLSGTQSSAKGNGDWGWAWVEARGWCAKRPRVAGPVATTTTTTAPTTTTTTAPTTTTTSTTSTTTTSTTTTSTTSTTLPGVNCTAPVSGSALSRTGWVATGSGTNPPYALDGNYGTRYTSGAPQVAGQFFEVDLGTTAQTFSELRMETPGSPTDYAGAYKVAVSDDGVNWTTVATCTGASSDEVVSFPAQTANYVEVVLTGPATAVSGGYWWSIDEFNLYN